MLFILSGLGVGILQPVQVSLNTRLRQFLRSSFYATLISFAIGLGLLVLILLPSGGPAAIQYGKMTAEPLWIWCAGFCGVGFLVSLTLLFPKLGGVQVVILPMLGQIIMGILIDQFALFGSAKIPVTALRLLGMLLIFAGILIVTLIQKKLPAEAGSNTDKQSVKKSGLPWKIAGVAIGAFSATQTAINGRVGALLSSPIQASFISFSMGIVLLSVICLCLFIRRKATGYQHTPELPRVWWMWLGGLIGPVILCVNTILANRLGTGLTVVLFITGQMLGGVLIDQFGLFGVARNPMNIKKAAGIVLALLGLVLIRLF